MITPRESNSNLATFLELIPRGRNTVAKAVRAWRKDVYRWDPWIFRDDGVYRLFYLMAPKPTPSMNFWSQGTIYGAVSTDLQNWKTTGIVLAPEPANLWESGRILAGSTYKENGIYYLFYSASGGGDLLKEERIGLAISTDGLNWKRYSSKPFFSEDEWSLWYGKQIDTNHFHWRDPYILKESNTGRYYMYICASSKTETFSKYQGCVAVAVSDTIAGPYTLLSPVAGPTVSNMEEWPFVEMERPQVIYKNGKYHLFFSCWLWNLNPKWIETLENPKIRESSLYWFVSDNVTGPFLPASNFPVVKGSEKTGLYATNFFSVQHDLEELIAIGWYHRIYTLQVSQLFKVYCEDESIEIRKNRLIYS